MKCRNFEIRAAVKPNDRLEEMLTLWRDVAVATSGTESAKDVGSPARWASKCMGDYAEVLVAIEKIRGGK